MSRVATIGTFDGIHRGHCMVIDMVKHIANQQDMSPCVFVFANHPLEIIAPERVPAKLMSFDSQLEMFMQLGVEAVPIHFNEEMRKMSAFQYMEFIRNEYDVRMLVVGHDNRFGSNRNENIEQYKSYGQELGIDVIAAPALPNVSSTIIRNLISTGDIRHANDKLGYFYTIEGIVEHGKHLGTTIGFPTANLRLLDNLRLVPANGVYAAIVKMPDKKQYGAMVNIGHCPTVNSQCRSRTIEINIFNFSADIYGNKISLSFVDFMRKERKMNGIDDLRCQLSLDRENAKKILENTKIGK